GGIADGMELAQCSFNLRELDAKAPEFDLIVDASEEVDVGIWEEPSEIAGHINASAWRFELIGDEAVGGKIRAVEIASADGLAGNKQLSGHPDGNGVEIWIKKINAVVGIRAADGDAIVE